MSFEFTPDKQVTSNQLWAVTSAVGAGLCFLVLILAALVYTHQPSRHHLDRVSFRIVMYALVGNTFFGIASAVGGQLTGPGFGCGFSIFVLQLTLEFSSFMLFSIALNLQLVVVHGINGRKMEKFYIVGSALMAVIITVPAYAAGQYGWDPLEKDCWYTNDNVTQRLAWQLGTQMIWTGLTVLGEVTTSLTVMLFMIRHHSRQKQIFTTSQQSSSSNSQSRSHSGGGGIAPANAPQVIHANNYRSVIVRIALYPLASMMVNALSIMTALHSTISSGIQTQNDYNILLLSDFLYGGRAVVYALLAASDPALLRGLKSLLGHTFPSLFGRNSRFGSQLSTKSISFAGFGKSSGRSRGHTSTFGGRSGGGADGMIVTIELETVREPDYAITTEGGGKDDKNETDTKDVREGSRERDKIENDEVASEKKVRDLEEGEIGLHFRTENDSEPYIIGAHPRPLSPSRTMTVDGTLSETGRPSTGDTVGLGRTASQREAQAGGGEGREGRSRQRRSWDVGLSMAMRRQREVMRKEEEDAFGRQL